MAVVQLLSSRLDFISSGFYHFNFGQFGEEFRPCRLEKFVYGIPRPKGQNDFAYAHTLDRRLFGFLQRHSQDKPILVFCPTRKGAVTSKNDFRKTDKTYTFAWVHLSCRHGGNSETTDDRLRRGDESTKLFTMVPSDAVFNIIYLSFLHSFPDQC